MLSVKTRKGPRIKSVIRREDTVIRYGGHGDCWQMSWAADDLQYLNLCDGMGFSAEPQAYYNSRMLSVSGGPRDATFQELSHYPMLGAPTLKPRDPRYYGFGVLALDGYLYQFLSTFNIPVERNGMLRHVGVKLIYSSDSGRTWRNQDGSTPVVWDSWDRRSNNNMLFWEEDREAFSMLAVLQMGKNYEHNRDGYVFVYAPNGMTEGTMNELVMFRVSRSQLLNRAAYEYFAGFEASGSANWSKNIDLRRPVHTFPHGLVNRLWHPWAWHPSVVYNAPLGLYMMTSWASGSGTDVDVLDGARVDDLFFAKASYLGIWIARNPWGPWTQIHEETAWMPAEDPNARAYEPQIAPKWIAPDGKSFWLVWSDFQMKDKEAMMRLVAESGRSPDALLQDAARWRQSQPYFGFNTQRVDLTIA